MVWWDNAPFTTGGPETIQTLSLEAGDRRFFVPVFLNLPRAVPDPRGAGTTTLGPGLFPTGNQFFGGVTQVLPPGRYTITLTIRQGDLVLATGSYDVVAVVVIQEPPASSANSLLVLADEPRLRELLETGTHTLLGADLSQNQMIWTWETWRDAVSQWTDRVKWNLRGLNKRDMDYFAADLNPQALPTVQGVHEAHSNLRTILAERIRRLDEIIRRMDQNR